MDSAAGLFDFLSLEEVLAIKARATALLAEGKTIMSAGGDGKNSSKQFTMPISQVMVEVNYRLRQLGYGGQTFVRRTRPDFSRGIR